MGKRWNAALITVAAACLFTSGCSQAEQERKILGNTFGSAQEATGSNPVKSRWIVTANGCEFTIYYDDEKGQWLVLGRDNTIVRRYNAEDFNAERLAAEGNPGCNANP